MTKITDQKLKFYFLGILNREESERLEEDLAMDAELTEHAQIIESELLDDYLRGNLSAAERRSFTENYLHNAARREKLKAAENLWKIAAENRTTETPAQNFSWRALFADYRFLTIGGLATAAIVCGAFVLFWLNSEKKSEIAKAENNNQPVYLEAINQNRQNSSNNTTTENSSRNANLTNNINFQKVETNNNAAPKPTVTPFVKSTPKPSAPMLAVFALVPGTLRSDGEQFIKISPNTEKVSLKLTLPNDAQSYQTYRAVVQTADGEIILAASKLKNLNLLISSEKLKNQTYLILLEGQNNQNPAESVAEYSFRVRR